MKLAISNIALPSHEHHRELAQLTSLGLEGLEVAPSRVWHDTWRGLTQTDVSLYRKTVEDCGLKIIGLHSLFYDHPEFGLFKDSQVRKETLDFMIHLSYICRDLGGKTLIYGGGRKRGTLPLDDAFNEAIEFFGELCNKIDGHGTVYCFEPLGPNDSDFINSVADSIFIVKSVNAPSLRVQLDAKALIENGDDKSSVFKLAKPYLAHFHANEPGMGILGTSGTIDHNSLGQMLKQIDYNEYVSIEQRMIDEINPLHSVYQSAQVLKDCYL